MLVLYKPLKNAQIDVPFGKDFTDHPVKSRFYKLFNNKHPGIDFAVKVNTPVFSAFEGIVVRKEFHKGMGNVIGIRNGNIVALYAHLNKFYVQLGTIVKQGQHIALSGKTGEALIIPHLHFELRDISKPTLPQMVFKPEFNKHLKNHTQVFTYKVNNTNTKKTLYSISKLFFGTTKYAMSIKKLNKLNIGLSNILPQGLEIRIPNYDIL